MLVALLLAMPAHAQQAMERVALVIGNANYPGSPLNNPGNDARAFAALLQRAGFHVDIRLDASRDSLLAAIGQFGARLKSPSIKLAVFFYAGHAIQLEWRNYLVPVDARVRHVGDIRQQTVDASELIRTMEASHDRSFLVILDACRDDPFAGSFRVPSKGLSPFDAPVGSLLAYSTAPGQVAYDGHGSNSLYTKHLVRELAVPDASLEDAFKRVRLSVHRESGGRQITWESTSLEHDVTLFPQRKSKLSDRELERRLERELEDWSKVGRSNDVDGLVEFIRSYPSGNVSELAQARLNRLLDAELQRAEQARIQAARDRALERQREEDRAKASRLAALRPQEATPRPAAAPASAPPKVESDAPVLPTPAPRPLEPSVVAPIYPSDSSLLAAMTPEHLQMPLVAIPVTPYYQGQSRHWRDLRVGDVLQFQVVDLFSKAASPLTMRVTAVDGAAERVEFNDGEFSTDMMGNTLGNRRGDMSTPRQFYPAELRVGKRWRTMFKQSRKSGLTYTFRYDVKVVGKETVQVPAGSFDAYRIEARGFNMDLGAQINRTIWVTPGVNADIAHETMVRLSNGRIEQNDRQELVSISRP